MSKQQQNCESVCPQCNREVKFIAIHELQPWQDCFLGSYICKCGSTLLMDYEVATQTVVARTDEEWRLHHKKETDVDGKFKSIKIGALSKESAIRMANRLNERHFKGQYANCHGTEVMKGQYVTTLFVEDNQEVKDAHVSAVRAWKKLLNKRELEESSDELSS
ncbi:hypothetical protein [Psychrobacter sp. JB193]|uniref:hypothetical protein n=1 Tax=Psychrobacter sp. JB193 TaxID=2024406 RepID=UPI000BAAFF6A|nr:hypothetical protein [Psychrobacter sp. JB193]PAT63101.1 hypothetical protein CIK80_11155 [Psychrobacter sp. JB193]